MVASMTSRRPRHVWAELARSPLERLVCPSAHSHCARTALVCPGTRFRHGPRGAVRTGACCRPGPRGAVRTGACCRLARRGLVRPHASCWIADRKDLGTSGFRGRIGGLGSTGYSVKPVSSTIFFEIKSQPCPARTTRHRRTRPRGASGPLTAGTRRLPGGPGLPTLPIRCWA
jgi:hypothetical protein